MRNKLMIFALCLFILGTASAQSKSYEISTDKENGAKVLRGPISRADIQQDTAFKWFNNNLKLGQMNPAAAAAFKKHSGDIQFVVFAGTWCEDTQNLLPVFYKLVDNSNFPDSSITLIGVDRTKKTLYNLHHVFHATRTPTFIIMKDGKEIGRVEEYGKYGQIDKELGEMVSAIQ